MKGHNSLGLYDGELPPGLLVNFDGGFQSEAGFDSLEPESVVGEPILGEIFEHFLESLPVEGCERFHIEHFSFSAMPQGPR